MNFVELNGITLNYKMINADSGKPVIVFPIHLAPIFGFGMIVLPIYLLILPFCYMTNAVMAYQALAPRPMPLMTMSATLLA